jgi:hypothetical protein
MENPVWDSRAPIETDDNNSPHPTDVQRWPRTVTQNNCHKVFQFLEQYSVLVCMQHYTGVVNLDKHLREQHNTPVTQRRAVVEYFSQYSRAHPSTIELPAQPIQVIQELGTPLDGLQCNTCSYITTNTDEMRKHCKKEHNISWTSNKSMLFQSVKVQTLFRGRSLRKYFIVDMGSSKKEENPTTDNVVLQQLSAYEEVRKELNEDEQVLGDTAKTDRTGWFNRTGWPEHLKKRNLVHLGHQARLPDRNEKKLQLAAQLTEQLIENCVKSLATMPREVRRWLRSAKQEELDVRPLARLQNPESQATYASYIVRFVCYYLRIIADEDRVPEDVDSSVALSSESGDDDSESYEDDDDDDNDENNSEGSTAPKQQPRKKVHHTDMMKDARELFPWRDQQRILAGVLWFALDGDNRTAQLEALYASLCSFIFMSTGRDPFTSGLIYFLAVLGINTNMGRLRVAKHYSYMLASIVYYIRVLSIEKLLPAAKRDIESGDDYKAFKDERRKYLANSLFSPISEMLNLLAYGKHITVNQGNAGNAY